MGNVACTEVSERLGIVYPIIQGPIWWRFVVDGEVAP